MAIDKVREYMKQFGKEQDIREFNESSATVELAAQAVGVEPARIAKTLSFCGKEEGSCLPVSYTHLDVYKRQRFSSVRPFSIADRNW